MARALLLWTVLLAASMAPAAQTPGVSAFLGRARLMPAIEPKQMMMPALADVPLDTKGALQIDTVVGQNGRVLHTQVVSSPDATGAFDGAAVTAVRSWRFRPAVSLGGQPMAVLVRVIFGIKPASAPDQPRLAVLVHEVPDETLPDDPAIWAAAKSVSRPMTFPKAIRLINPSYSEAAMRAKVVGIVELEVAIAPDGSVAGARVKKSLDKEHGLDRQALLAARYWLFEPARLNGEPLLSKAVLQLEFRLH